LYEKKKNGKKMLQLWRKGKLSKDRFIEERKKLIGYPEEKQSEKREKEKTELRTLKKEGLEIYKQEKKQEYDNGKYRRRRVERPFQKITGRSEEEEIECKREDVRGMEETGNIEEKEIKEVVRKMKNKKAAIDRIPMKIWKNAGKDLWKSLVKRLNLIWRSGIIENWKKV